MHDGVRDGVGAEGEASDGDDGVGIRPEPGANEVEHDPPDGGGRPVIERELAHIDVVRRLLAAGQGEVAVEDRFGADEGDEGLAVGFEFGRGGSGHSPSLGKNAQCFRVIWDRSPAAAPRLV